MNAKELYDELMKLDYLPNMNGLCSEFANRDMESYEDSLSLLEPLDSSGSGFWGSDIEPDICNKAFIMRAHDFGPLRQTILLFIAAMHDEL